MRFEKSPYFEKLNPHNIKLKSGHYYFCKNLVVSEVFEGIHFDWEMTKELLDEIYAFYGPDTKLAYIANRINSYSLDPQIWSKIDENVDILVASAIVSYNDANYINASIEKNFTSKSMKRCLSIHEAIDWIQNLREFN